MSDKTLRMCDGCFDEIMPRINGTEDCIIVKVRAFINGLDQSLHFHDYICMKEYAQTRIDLGKELTRERRS